MEQAPNLGLVEVTVSYLDPGQIDEETAGGGSLYAKIRNADCGLKFVVDEF
ncbi:hypothetical protein [Natronomonas sp. LN261]|jgi:hypothetical protein|uniref:hypothetical protein n=1 Tax=Natronomonas sp. LN261 TaxID=2750669 RepID=UPI0015EF5960|nr:hypothetical protein [Natronomonas sp. LN261]